MNKIKLMADYHCHPLWIYDDTDDLLDNGVPEEISLSSELRSALDRWSHLYDQTMNFDDPYMSPGFASPAEEDAFEIEGRRLWKELQSELGGEYKVVYYSSRESSLVD